MDEVVLKASFILLLRIFAVNGANKFKSLYIWLLCCFIEINWFVKCKICHVLIVIQLLYVHISRYHSSSFINIYSTLYTGYSLYIGKLYLWGYIGNVLSWTVEGNSLTDPSNQDREISVTTNNISVDVWSSVLTIRALPINDGIGIQCSVISFDPLNLQQKGVTLTVKGIWH